MSVHWNVDGLIDCFCLCVLCGLQITAATFTQKEHQIELLEQSRLLEQSFATPESPSVISEEQAVEARPTPVETPLISQCVRLHTFALNTCRV